MPRPIWSGTVSFGLVSIPVKLTNAVSRKSISFNQLDARTGSRIRYRKVSALDGEEVPSDRIVKGYEVAKDRYVTFTDDELDALDPAATRAIEIEEFVDLAEIDPIYFDAAYYLTPDRGAAKPYALLARVMEETGKVAIARFVMRSKQYLAAIRAQDGHLVLSTMVYADEVVDPATLDGIDEAAGVAITERELAMAAQLVGSLTAPFEPDKFHDTHRQELLARIEAKAAGETVEPVAPAADHPRVADLLAALEASVAEAKAARGRHPSTGPHDTAVAETRTVGEPEAADRRRPARTRRSA